MNIRWTSAVVRCIGPVAVYACRSLVAIFLAVASAVAASAFHAAWLVSTVVGTVAETLVGVTL